MKRIYSTFVVLPCLSILVSSAYAQHVNESTPRGGESRANKHQYLSCHNAYSGQSLTELLDVKNVWGIELDVRYTDPCVGDSGFWVMHHCADLSGEGWLHEYLDEIAATQRFQTGFFFLNLELGEGYVCLGCFDGPLFPDDNGVALSDLIKEKFGEENIYTWTDFVADNFQWPSPQELIRRGKHVAIHHNWSGDLNDFFFHRGGLGASGTSVFWNTADQNAHIPDQGDRAFSRRYPAHDCVSESTANWETAFDRGFSFASTNCIDSRIETHYQRFHPPIPTYVSHVSVPDFVEGHGTSGLPFFNGVDGLFDACELANAYNNHTVMLNGTTPQSHPSNIPVVLEPGTYDISSNGGTLNAPVTLRPYNGIVTLQ